MPAISSSANHSFDKTNPLAIYDFSRLLIGQSLHSLFGEEAISQKRKGKGGLGQMVEEMFFGYEVNSKQDADFQEANVELKITVRNNRDGSVSTEHAYILDKVFFWTMPTDDLEIAREYWEDIRRNVITDNIRRDAFWKLSDHRKFHVRPKATRETQKAVNPNGGECNKFCYWFNAEYVKQIIDTE